MLRDVRDTFTRFIADNVADAEIPVHQLRRDPLDPATMTLSSNAINIQFLSLSVSFVESKQDVVLSIVNDSELVALGWTDLVVEILISSYMTSLKDYTDTEAPVLLGSNIYWDRERVVFRPIYTDGYFQYNCNLALRFRHT